MIDRPFYYNNPLNLELKGLTRDKTVDLLTEQKDKRFGLLMVIQAAAFIAISCIAFAAVAFVARDSFKAVAIGLSGLLIGGGSAYLFYSYFFGITTLMSSLRTKYSGPGEIALSDIEKIVSLSSEETQEKLLKQMSFEQAMIARQFVDPAKFNSWMNGSDWSAVLNYKEENIPSYGPIIEKNLWFLRAIEPHLNDKQYFDLAVRNLKGQPKEVFGVFEYLENMAKDLGSNEKGELPISEITQKLIAGEFVELNLENLKKILESAEWLNSGALYRFVDEHVYTHMDQFKQQDLIDLVDICPSLMLVRSHLARQILSRNLTQENWREYWSLASRVSKPELREKFASFALNQNDIYLAYDVLNEKDFKNWFIVKYPFKQALALFEKELESPTGLLETLYVLINEYKWMVDWDKVVEVNKNNFRYLANIADLKKYVDSFMKIHWKELMLENGIAFESLMNDYPEIQKELLAYLNENHAKLIEDKIITQKAWDDYKSIYFS